MPALTIRSQLIGLLGILVALLIGLGVFATNRLGAVNDVSVELRTNQLASIVALSEVDREAFEYRGRVSLHVLNEDAAAISRLDREVAELAQRLGTAFATYDRLVSSAAERAEADRAKRAIESALASAETVLVLSRRNDNVPARETLQTKTFPNFAALGESLERLKRINLGDAERLGNEAAATYGQSFTLLLGAAGAATLFAGLAGFLVLRGIGRGIDAVRQPMEGMAKGRLDVAMPNLPPTTEMGQIGATLRVFHTAMVEKRDRDQAQLGEAEAAKARADRLGREIARFESEVEEALRSMSAAATELDATASSMQDTAQRGIARAGAVAGAASQADSNVQAVAASTEELTQSISEVARQVGESATVARRAAEDARSADRVITSLADSANRIGDVVRLINDIAGQTNLLALNATIEAARAGEAGKGFAVVAAEVKNLANQTAKATDEIGGQISGMQQETTRAVEALRGIGATIEELNRIAGAVAAATEEQAAATREIGRAVHAAAAGTNEVTGSTAEVERDASGSATLATQVAQASNELSRHSEKLRGQVSSFLQGMRAA